VPQRGDLPGIPAIPRFARVGLPRVSAMPTKRTPKTAEPRMWRVSIIKSKLQYLGRVLAVDKVQASDVAAVEFKLSDQERARLVIEQA
jgi:hypothetical protein